MDHLEPKATMVTSQEKSGSMASSEADIVPIPSRCHTTPNPFTRRNSKMDIDDYFVSHHISHPQYFTANSTLSRLVRATH